MTAPSHIVVVTLENQDIDDLVGSTAQAPFFNQLVSEGMLFTNYNALAHPSQPNYLALFSGSMQGVTTDTVPSQFPSTVPTLASTLAANGLTFAGYAETAADPAHTPWVDFADSAADAQNFSAFPTTASGFAALPTVSFVTPSNADNMTDSIASGDQWLQANLAAYAAWAQANNSLLIVTFDENDNDAPPNRSRRSWSGPASRRERPTISQRTNMRFWRRSRTYTD
jgi:arylsulfatase A-like enzyme